MNPHLYTTLRWLPNIAFICTLALVLFVGLVTWDTLKDDGNRVVMLEGKATGVRNVNGELVVMYKRSFKVKREGDGILSRKITCTCSKGQVDEFDLPAVQQWWDAATYTPITRWLDTPMKVDKGTKCTLQVYGQWRHRFAITAKYYLLDQLDFVVE